MDKPTIDVLIDFIRGARHIVAKNKKVEVNCSHKEILMGIEERLLDVKLYEEQREKGYSLIVTERKEAAHG